MDEDDGVVMPIASLEAVYGLNADGVPILAVTWSNHGVPVDVDVDHLTKAGMLGMIQEGVLMEVMTPEEDDDGEG